ncbi:MAG: DUF3276 family protein [Bacteroidota bacterium]
MEGIENKDREEIFSRAVRAGKRTYFFDVKATKSGDFYLTITESKKRFTLDGKFSYEKHKLFLYKEDFEKFATGLNEVVDYIQTGKIPEDDESTHESSEKFEESTTEFDVDFSDLGKTEDL